MNNEDYDDGVLAPISNEPEKISIIPLGKTNVKSSSEIAAEKNKSKPVQYVRSQYNKNPKNQPKPQSKPAQPIQQIQPVQPKPVQSKPIQPVQPKPVQSKPVQPVQHQPPLIQPNLNQSQNSILSTESNKSLSTSPDNYLTCIIHKNNGMNECLCSIDIPKMLQVTDDSFLPEFIILLDISGSMYDCLGKILNKSIPHALEVLKYKKKPIHLITFAAETEEYLYTIQQMRKSPIEAFGATYMAPTFPVLQKILEDNGPEKDYRILTMTDGVLFDQAECKAYADNLYQLVNIHKNYNINSRVGRMMREGIDPNEVDTETLLSVARFSSLTFSKDVAEIQQEWPEDQIGEVIADLYKQDGMEGKYILRSENNILRLNPIDEPSTEIILNTGNSKFWVSTSNIEGQQGTMQLIGPKGVFNVVINLPNRPVEKRIDALNMIVAEELTSFNYINILGDKLPNMIQTTVANRIHNSEQSRNENKKLINYFKKLEENLPGPKTNCIVAKCIEEVEENKELEKISNDDLKDYINIEVKKNLDKAKEEAVKKYKANLPYTDEQMTFVTKELEDYDGLLKLFIKYCDDYKRLAIDCSSKTLFRKSDTYMKMKDDYITKIREAFEKLSCYVQGIDPPDAVQEALKKMGGKNYNPKPNKQKNKFEYLKLIAQEVEIIVTNSGLISDVVPTIEWLSIPLCDRNTEKGKLAADQLVNLVDTGKKIRDASLKLKGGLINK